MENALGLEPADEDERPVKLTQDDKWRLNLAAAKAFHAREGHLQVPRKHVESVEPHGGSGGAQSGSDVLGVVDVKLGMVLDNVRRRAEKPLSYRM
ncbi:helicase associated domain-containing protein [Streptomyces sp. NPDC087440]|uniref:helicase associated domain-containing protein n=1 Tax=Streptomyces sp. NPDC087440 TaxID=3365790 RepID=UPI00380AF5D7